MQHEKLLGLFTSGRTRAIDWRLGKLRRLASFLKDHEIGLVEALKVDFKSHFEAIAEVRTIQTAVVEAIDKLDVWMSPEYCSRSLGIH